MGDLETDDLQFGDFLDDGDMALHSGSTSEEETAHVCNGHSQNKWISRCPVNKKHFKLHTEIDKTCQETARPDYHATCDMLKDLVLSKNFDKDTGPNLKPESVHGSTAKPCDRTCEDSGIQSMSTVSSTSTSTTTVSSDGPSKNAIRTNNNKTKTEVIAIKNNDSSVAKNAFKHLNHLNTNRGNSYQEPSILDRRASKWQCSTWNYSSASHPTSMDPDLDASSVESLDLSTDGKTKSLYGSSPHSLFGPKACIKECKATTLTIQDPATQKLVWTKPPLSVLVIKKIADPEVVTPFLDLAAWLLQERSMVVFVEAKVLEDDLLKDDHRFHEIQGKLCTFKEGVDDLKDKIDFIICLGGDGTLLYASSLFQQSVPPIMAFHLGSLGFLTPWSFDDFKSQVMKVLDGKSDLGLTLRCRLKAVIHTRGMQCANDLNSDSCSIKHKESKENILVLNEVVVGRGPSPYLCNLDLYIEHRYVTSVQADGLIISTPTGSTAYATAAGASMIHPNVPAILIAPVCPHSLSFRPIVVPAGVEIKIMVAPDARDDAYVSFDGRNRQLMSKGDTLRISTSIYPVPSISAIDQISDWFDSLSSCLHWNVRKQQRAFTVPDIKGLHNDS